MRKTCKKNVSNFDEIVPSTVIEQKEKNYCPNARKKFTH